MLENIEKRNRDLMRAIARVKARLSGERDRIETREVMERAVLEPAPSYYVEFDRAVKATGRVLRGLEAVGSALRQEQWQEIAGKARELMERDGLRLHQAVARVIAFEGASRFFITSARALTIYHEEMRHRY